MTTTRVASVTLRMMLVCVLACFALGCGSQAQEAVPQNETPAEGEAATEATAEGTPLADGTYDIQVDTDSSMFRADSCTLTVKGDAYTVALTLPGEGFSRLYFGSAEEAAQADEALIYDYYLNNEGKYTFDLPVSALDEDLPIAAFGQRRDTWYDHVICFHVPTDADAADAA